MLMYDRHAKQNLGPDLDRNCAIPEIFFLKLIDVYETLCPQPFACQEGFISFQCLNLQRAIT